MKGKIQRPYKNRALHRLRIIQGQLRGLEKMVEDEKYCIDVLTQALAIQESIKSFSSLMLENHLKTHASRLLRGNNKNKAINELVNIYKLNQK
ncbi:MAG: hypothetical protein COT81_05160 [Candidatus Buchananbacteria bacterium CG10_big_fil_rev_8_21_14_0_10_42_9]|uniref:Transcriptional regulator n=1 Tax=Candidatus Buchananbacteria bacterium CG10_big_fil_rev_8_21_14_0_10_42_9 TaxID=1974526 RepID=A0A2H0W017_9BACT|nr:MAG: hypothetical protein COT81_05160 [Candidatus Buchananbacteria bacterium CG10_big_fil_rev_8_21_14_0_10_42_9]